MSVTVGAWIGSLTQVVSFESIIVRVKNRANLASTGAITMQVLGLGFGLNSVTSLTHVGYSGTERTEWTSDSRITTQVAANMRSTLRMVVTSEQVVSRSLS